LLSKFSVKRPYTVLVGVVLVIVLGVVSLMKMTTDLLPKMSLPYVLVITTDMGASPETVEAEVTSKFEAALATTSNLENISSMSYNSYSMIILEYAESSNMDSVVIEIQQSLDQAKAMMDENVGAPIIMQLDPNMIPIMIASVGVEGMTNTELALYVDNEIVPQLESVEGVASVTANGGIEETIQVTIDSDKVDKLNKKIQDTIDKGFRDAENEVARAKEELESGKSALESGKSSLANEVSSARTQLDTQKIQLYTSASDIEAQIPVLESTINGLTGAIDVLQQAYDGAQKISEGIASLESVLGLVDQGVMNEEQFAESTGMTVEEAKTQLAGLQAQLDAVNQQISGQAAILSAYGVSVSGYEDIPTAIETLAGMKAQSEVGLATLQEAKSQIESGKVTIDEAMTTLNRSEIMGSLKLAESETQVTIGMSGIEQAEKTIEEQKTAAKDAADLRKVLSVSTLEQLLVAQNFNMPAGNALGEEGQYLVKIGDAIASPEELQELVLLDLGMDGIEPIRLSDIATVEVVDNSAEVYAKVNGENGIILTFQKQTGYSTGDVTDAIQKRFKSLKKTEEEPVQFAVLMDQGVYIDIIVESIVKNMLIGALLAIIVLVIFLRDLRPTLIIACAIPLSVVFAVVLMYFSDISLNIISMSGLTLGIGMLVDNSIVVIENIFRLRGEGKSVKQACVYGAGQMAGAITSSTLTTVCVFAPIVFTEGITRQLFVDMGLTIGYTLVASLIVALTLVPAMAQGMLRKSKPKEHKSFDRFLERYGKFLGRLLKWKPLVFLGLIGMLVLSVFLAMSRGTEFMPEMNGTQISVSLTPYEDSDTTYAEMTEYSDTLMERLMTISDVETIGAMTSSGTGLSMMSAGDPNTVTMYVLMKENAKTSNKKMQEKIEEFSSDLDCTVSVQTNMMDMSAMGGSGISIRIKGRDMETMQRLAAETAAILEKTEGIEKVDAGLDDMSKEFIISVDRAKAAKYKMTTAQVFQLVYTELASSRSSTTVSTDVKDYDVFVRTDKQAAVTIDELEKLTFSYTDQMTQETKDIPLSQIATFRETEALSRILRDSQSRYINVTGLIDDDHNIGLVSNDVRDALSGLDVPEGYSVKMEGEDETINEAMFQLGEMLLLAVILIYLIMVAQFQSLLSPFIIMFTIPLAFTGGLLGLYLTGNPISVISMIGFVMLSGIIVNNGIVLVDTINQLRRTGMSKKEAIVEASKTRLRPVLMTALTTVISMSTMAMGYGQGTEMGRPMAMVVVGGMIYGTILTLVMVPCLYDAFNREKDMRDYDIDADRDEELPMGSPAGEAALAVSPAAAASPEAAASPAIASVPADISGAGAKGADITLNSDE